ncbi:MAG: cache domain-containing protein [Candidatus Omnitrophica bacterium]|nr:cache domain-containing protein [Candidatus Omnitrophota bacterium]
MFTLLNVILLLGACMTVFGFFVVKNNIFETAQDKVSKDLEIVRLSYDRQFEQMQLAFNLIDAHDDLGLLRNYLDLDYLYWVPKENISLETSEIVKRVNQTTQDVGATRIIPEKQVELIKGKIDPIKIRSTNKAHPTDRTELNSVMALEYAKPFMTDTGHIEKILVGGKFLNRNYKFVDDIVGTVFEKRLYKGKPVGTITIFQGDVRVATNVLDESGQRAIGTRVSDVVYNTVIKQGKKWLDKAFVVTDWYFTAYEPILNINGDIIGILYIGVLEKPFTELQRDLFLTLISIIGATLLITILFSYIITNSMVGSLNKILKATSQISEGNLESRIDEKTDVKELNELMESINKMSGKLAERDERLDVTNEKLEILNKRYLDLIGFVAHEFKGVLSSVVLNTYLFNKGILGPINEKQANALKSMARNLDYLTVTVKNFLNLSRIEKDELNVTKNELKLKENVFDVAVDAFAQQAIEKEMCIKNNIDPELKIVADSALLQIVANNLISNAIKYGKQKGELRIDSRNLKDMIEVEVYNDGTPIAEVDIEKLFKKFSRVLYRGMESVKGTGIGLFITNEIVKQHGGSIKVIPRQNGNSFIFEIEKQ